MKRGTRWLCMWGWCREVGSVGQVRCKHVATIWLRAGHGRGALRPVVVEPGGKVRRDTRAGKRRAPEQDGGGCEARVREGCAEVGPLLIGSLFSGIGGLELGLERALGWSVAWQVEQDEWCRRVLTKHWPSAERFDDVRTVGATQLARVDLICGGFPCQDVSGAGLGRGIAEGTRSGLWIEFDRIVGELQPDWVVVENVASGQSRWLPRVRHDLRARGYDTCAYSISAADVGAPQLRRRVFVVAHPNGDELRQRAEWIAGGWQALQPPQDAKPEHARAHVWPAGRGRPHVGPQLGVRRGSDGVSRRLDKARLKALGNAVVPQCAEAIGRVIAAMDDMRSEAAT